MDYGATWSRPRSPESRRPPAGRYQHACPSATDHGHGHAVPPPPTSMPSAKRARDTSANTFQANLRAPQYIIRKYNSEYKETDHDYALPLHHSLSEFCDNVVSYIAKYIVKYLKERCSICIDATEDASAKIAALNSTYDKKEK